MSESDLEKFLSYKMNTEYCFFFPGVVDYLNTEISTSKQKKFSLVTFIDTPGLVDGDMKYPFDVNQSILWLGELDTCHNDNNNNDVLNMI